MLQADLFANTLPRVCALYRPLAVEFENRYDVDPDIDSNRATTKHTTSNVLFRILADYESMALYVYTHINTCIYTFVIRNNVHTYSIVMKIVFTLNF